MTFAQKIEQAYENFIENSNWCAFSEFLTKALNNQIEGLTQ